MAPENKPEKKIDKKYVETPLMKQYYSIKAVHPDAILLFRVGDFYETFGEDAIKASKILGITLTRRANGAASYVELAGFPYHAVDTYLPKLVRAGERVAAERAVSVHGRAGMKFLQLRLHDRAGRASCLIHGAPPISQSSTIIIPCPA